ncbi:MAG: DUF6516 family protein [Methanobacteriaceae archaeon]|jgi:hypothetical protein
MIDDHFELLARQKKLITRWDNAPHHKEVETFPQHVGENIKPLKEPTFIEILRWIEMRFENR